MGVEALVAIAGIAGSLSAIFAAWKMLVVPVKDGAETIADLKTGMKCLLRQGMLQVYYVNREKKELRQYEMENFEFMYKAYKALSGNSFIDTIHKEVQKWEVIA